VLYVLAVLVVVLLEVWEVLVGQTGLLRADGREVRLPFAI
jgi:hypothetical protein